MQNIVFSPIDIDTLVNKIATELQERLQSQRNNTIPENEYITRQETAKKCKISLPTLSEYTKIGVLPGYRFGSRVLYKAAEVDAALKHIVTTKYKRR